MQLKLCQQKNKWQMSSLIAKKCLLLVFLLLNIIYSSLFLVSLSFALCLVFFGKCLEVSMLEVTVLNSSAKCQHVILLNADKCKSAAPMVVFRVFSQSQMRQCMKEAVSVKAAEGHSI